MKLTWLFQSSAVVVALLVSIGGAGAVTLDELRADVALTPEKFAAHFTNFEFRLREKVQRPEVFLANGNGDCDDYATLAADVLREKGYTPRLVVIYMPKDTHVVCYIAETKSYLDFNVRDTAQATVASDGSLDDIAEKVAKSFQSSWHCVSEFTYQNGVRRVVQVDFPRAKPSEAVVAAPPKDTRNQIAAAETPAPGSDSGNP